LAAAIHATRQMQVVYARTLSCVQEFYFPNPETEVMPGIRWGQVDVVGSPAYWAALSVLTPDVLDSFTECGGSLREEIVFCLLGGFGITAEVATAAFHRLREMGLIDYQKSDLDTKLLDALTLPLIVNGRPVRYRGGIR